MEQQRDPREARPHNPSGVRLVRQPLPVYQGADISPEEREAKLKLVHGQTMEIVRHEHGANVPRVTCPGCERRLKIMWMYRCLYCSIYFCKECAEHHFGASVPKPLSLVGAAEFDGA